jgi:NAD-dependent SIR2 family protein deacetylase
MGRLSPQLERKIHRSIEPTKCDQCDQKLEDDFVGKEYFVSSKNWSGVAMIYCRGCEDRRAEKFDDVQNCAICDSIVVEDEIVWYNSETDKLDTDKGDPYCVGCVPNEKYASV